MKLERTEKSKEEGKSKIYKTRRQQQTSKGSDDFTSPGNMRRNRSSFSFPEFSLRRLLLHGTRAARGSPTLGNRCDIEKGTGSSSKGEKPSTTPANKVRATASIFFHFTSFLWHSGFGESAFLQVLGKCTPSVAGKVCARLVSGCMTVFGTAGVWGSFSMVVQC